MLPAAVRALPLLRRRVLRAPSHHHRTPLSSSSSSVPRLPLPRARPASPAAADSGPCPVSATTTIAAPVSVVVRPPSSPARRPARRLPLATRPAARRRGCALPRPPAPPQRLPDAEPHPRPSPHTSRRRRLRLHPRTRALGRGRGHVSVRDTAPSGSRLGPRRPVPSSIDLRRSPPSCGARPSWVRGAPPHPRTARAGGDPSGRRLLTAAQVVNDPSRSSRLRARRSCSWWSRDTSGSVVGVRGGVSPRSRGSGLGSSRSGVSGGG